MKFLMKLYVILSMLFVGSAAFADGTPPTMELMMNVGDEVSYIIKIALAISGLVGLVLVVHGIHKIRSHPMDNSGTGGFWRQGMIQLIVGGLLFTVPVTSLLVGSSLFDNTPSNVTSDQCVFKQVSSNDYSDPGCVK